MLSAGLSDGVVREELRVDHREQPIISTATTLARTPVPATQEEGRKQHGDVEEVQERQLVGCGEHRVGGRQRQYADQDELEVVKECTLRTFHSRCPPSARRLP